jgi:hypothetical protein
MKRNTSVAPLWVREAIWVGRWVGLLLVLVAGFASLVVLAA